MLMKLDTTWLLFAVATVVMLSYLFSVGLHALLRDAGFGPLGNAAIIAIGFFAAVHAGNAYGIRFAGLPDAVFTWGAFALFLLAVIVKPSLSWLI